MRKRNEGGMGFMGNLQIAFIVLKLCGVIQWSWAGVFAPIYISAGTALIVALIELIHIL